jgi:hypothetical protein
MEKVRILKILIRYNIENNIPKEFQERNFYREIELCTILRNLGDQDD